MYKEQLVDDKTNERMAKRIETKMAASVKEISTSVGESETEATFAANLLGLCVLNRMADSHQKGGKP